MFPCFTKFSAFAALISGKLHCKLFTGALVHASQAGDPPSPPVGWAEVSVTALSGHGGMQARQVGPS